MNANQLLTFNTQELYTCLMLSVHIILHHKIISSVATHWVKQMRLLRSHQDVQKLHWHNGYSHQKDCRLYTWLHPSHASLRNLLLLSHNLVFPYIMQPPPPAATYSWKILHMEEASSSRMSVTDYQPKLSHISEGCTFQCCNSQT
jgi:hypothetical protein